MSDEHFDGELAAENLYKRVHKKLQIKWAAESYISRNPTHSPQQLSDYLKSIVKKNTKPPKKPKKD